MWEKAVRKHEFCKMPVWKCVVKILIRLQKKSYSEFLSIHFCDSRQVSQKTQAPCRFSRTKGVSEDGESGLGLLSSTASSLMQIYLFALYRR